MASLVWASYTDLWTHTQGHQQEIHGCRAPSKRLLRTPVDERMRTAAHSAGDRPPRRADLGLEGRAGFPWGQEAGEGVPANRSPQGLLCTCEAGEPWGGAWSLAGRGRVPDTCFLLCTRPSGRRGVGPVTDASLSTGLRSPRGPPAACTATWARLHKPGKGTAGGDRDRRQIGRASCRERG